MPTDAELLQRYVAENSEAAFRELVTRHLPLVYSAALRQLAGDAHLAQDVAQTVFVALARKAAALTSHGSLAGWLYLGTHHAAAQAVRANRRRVVREQEAHAMQTRLAPETSAADWDRVRPVLDAAMRELSDADREAVLLRYFEARPFAEIGTALHLSQDAARMRVDRALDKLHAALAKRGVTSTTAALVLALQGQAVAAVPAGLAASITSGVVTTVTTGVAAGGWLSALGSNLTTSTIATVAAAVSVGAAFFQERHRREAERALQEISAEHGAAFARVRDLRANLERAEREAAAAASPAPPIPSHRTTSSGAVPATDPGTQIGKEFLAAHPEAQSLLDAVMRSLGGTSSRGLALRNLGLSREEWQRAELEMGRSTTASVSIGGFSFSVGPETDPRGPGGNRLAAVLGETRYEQLSQQEMALRSKSVVRTLASAACDSDLALSPEQVTALGALIDANRRLRPKTDRALNYEMDWAAVTERASEVLSPGQLAVFKTLVAREGAAQTVPLAGR